MRFNQAFLQRRLLSGLALSLILLFATPAMAKNSYVSVIKDGTNIRATPAANGELHGEVFAGFPLQTLESKGNWSKVVDFEGDQGWINNTMISPKKSVIVRAKKIELREAPNTNADNQIVVLAKYGVTFAPLESRGEWLKVRHDDGSEGWLLNSQVWPAKPFESTTGAAPTPKPTKHKKASAASTTKKKHATKAKKHKARHK